MSGMTVVVLALTIIQAIQAVIVLGLLRQVGILNLRILPAGAKTLPMGPKIGEMPPSLELADVDDAGSILQLPPTDSRPWIITFVSPGCSTCHLIAPGIQALAAETAAVIGWAVVCLGQPTECSDYKANHKMRRVMLCHASSHIRDLFQIGTTPYALVFGANGLLAAKGLVNHIEHLESLVNVAKRLPVFQEGSPLQEATAHMGVN